MKLPSMPQRGGSVETTVRDIINYIRATTVTSVNGGILKETPNGTIINVQKPGVTATSGATACPFGEIITVDDGTYTRAISGGVFLCGDKNFNVPYRGIVLATSGSWLVQLTLTGIDPATDDDDQVFLSGIITASGTPAWGTVAYTGSESYTSNTNPASPSGTGTIVIPIGILVVASGAATLTPVGCGTIEATQCGGILTHTRG